MPNFRVKVKQNLVIQALVYLNDQVSLFMLWKTKAKVEVTVITYLKFKKRKGSARQVCQPASTAFFHAENMYNFFKQCKQV